MGCTDRNGIYNKYDSERSGESYIIVFYTLYCILILSCLSLLYYGAYVCLIDLFVPVIVDGKANNEIKGRHELDGDCRIVLTFESTGCDSIVYNTIKIGDRLEVYNIHSDYWGRDNNWGHGKRKFPNNGKNIRYINNKSIPQLKEYERYKKQQAKATARSNLGK